MTWPYFILKICMLGCLCSSKSETVGLDEDFSHSAPKTTKRSSTTTTTNTRNKPQPLPDVTLKQKSNYFPEVEYPSDILELGIVSSFYINPHEYQVGKVDHLDKTSYKFLSNDKNNKFVNYKRKQRIQAMDSSLKKVLHETMKAESKETDTIEDKKSYRFPQKGISIIDKIKIDKLINKNTGHDHVHYETKDTAEKKPYVPYKGIDVQDKIRINKLLSKKPWAQNNKSLPSTEEIVDELIAITEEIFDSVILYIGDSETDINSLTEKEATEICQLVMNLEEVLAILEQLIADLNTTPSLEEIIRELVANKGNATETKSEACKLSQDLSFSNRDLNNSTSGLSKISEENLSISSSTEESNDKTDLPSTKIASEAISTIEFVLKNALSNTTNSISNETYDMITVIDNFKQVLGTLDLLDENITLISNRTKERCEDNMEINSYISVPQDDSTLDSPVCSTSDSTVSKETNNSGTSKQDNEKHCPTSDSTVSKETNNSGTTKQDNEKHCPTSDSTVSKGTNNSGTSKEDNENQSKNTTIINITHTEPIEAKKLKKD